MSNFVVGMQKEISSEFAKLIQKVVYNTMNKLNEQNEAVGNELSNIWEYINSDVYQEIQIAKNSVENIKKYLDSEKISDQNDSKEVLNNWVKELNIIKNNIKDNLDL